MFNLPLLLAKVASQHSNDMIFHLQPSKLGLSGFKLPPKKTSNLSFHSLRLVCNGNKHPHYIYVPTKIPETTWETFSSWWLNHPFEKYARQNGNLPQNWDESKKYLKPPPRKSLKQQEGNLFCPRIKWSRLRMRFAKTGLAAIGARMRSGAFRSPSNDPKDGETNFQDMDVSEK